MVLPSSTSLNPGMNKGGGSGGPKKSRLSFSFVTVGVGVGLGVTSAGEATARVTKTRAMRSLSCIFVWSSTENWGMYI